MEKAEGFRNLKPANNTILRSKIGVIRLVSEFGQREKNISKKYLNVAQI